MTQRIYVCTHCGSPRVLADAWSALNIDEVRTYEDYHCDDCGGECSIQQVEVDDDFDIEVDAYKEVEMTKLEELKAAFEAVEGDLVEFTVTGETSLSVYNSIRYYSLSHNLMPHLLEAATMLSRARSLIVEAVNVHIYDVDNGDVPDPDCPYMAFLDDSKDVLAKLKEN